MRPTIIATVVITILYALLTLAWGEALVRGATWLGTIRNGRRTSSAVIIHKQGQAICSKNIVQSNDALRGSELARAQLTERGPG